MKGKPEGSTVPDRERLVDRSAVHRDPDSPPAPAVAGRDGGEDPFREIVEGARHLIYRLDSEGRFTYLNPATERLTGRSREELLGTPLLDLVRADCRPVVERALAALTADDEPGGVVEFAVVTRAGAEIWLGQLAQLIRGPGPSHSIQAESRDITATRLVRDSLAESEERLRAVVESLGEGLLVTDADDRVLYVNAAFERITGYGASDLVGNRALDLMTIGGEQAPRNAARRSWSDLRKRYEVRIRHRAGHWVDLRVIITPLREGQGEPFALLSAVTDIGEQKRKARALDCGETIGLLAQSGREAFWIATSDLKTPLYVSPAYEEIMGAPRETIMSGRPSLMDFVHPEDRPRIEAEATLERAIAGGFEIEFRVVRPDGEVRWLRSRTFAVRDPDGDVYRLAGVAEDVTERRAALEAIERTETSYRGLYNSLSDLIYIQDLEGRFLNVNDAVVRAYGFSREELIGATPTLLADPERTDLETLDEHFRLAAEGKPQRFEFWGQRKDGSSFPKEVVLTRTVYFGHEAVMAVARDISERIQAQVESERLAALSRDNPSPVLECDASGKPIHINPSAAAAARELGLDGVEGLLPANHRELVEQALQRGDGFDAVEVLVSGRIFEWTYRPHASSGVVHLYAADVTGRRLMEEQLRHDALHDALTNLPNRLLFMERLEHVVHRARRREGALFAVLFLDLDRFKVINDSLGHHVGDELLVGVAERLRGSVRTEDTVARFGGDEFAILVESIGDVSDATRVAERIHEALQDPLHLEGYDLVMSASVGIALGSSAEEVPANLLRNADVAMYRAKSAGPGRFEVFDRKMHVAALGRLQMETELRSALERGELVLQYQPVASTGLDRICSLEALLRWRHPERGWLLPGDFIPLAEETGMVRPIGGWVVREACRQLVDWRERLGEAVAERVAVNVSARQFVDEELFRQVDEALLESGLPADALCLEVTESAMMENVDEAAALLDRLKRRGVRVCVDDFGTGYSSLSYLHRFPLDEVKIDGSFIRRIGQEPGTMQLVRTMITLAHSLGARAVAEGVETEEQVELLRTLGVDLVQGYFIARPLDPEALEPLLLESGGGC